MAFMYVMSVINTGLDVGLCFGLQIFNSKMNRPYLLRSRVVSFARKA
jgi:hypothetical protein